MSDLKPCLMYMGCSQAETVVITFTETEMGDKKILNTSDEAAKFVTGLEGWVDRTGRFYGKDERMARWSGCTHLICDCGNEHEKSRTCCEQCSEKNRTERFNALEKKLWDGETPLCCNDSDEFFFDSDSLIEYAEENNTVVADMRLRLCKPIKIRALDADYFVDELHEDAELPADIAEAVEKLNKLILAADPQSWEASKFAAIVEL